MRYEHIRQHVQDHFRARLSAFKEKVAIDGSLEGDAPEQALQTKSLADMAFNEWLDLLYQGDGQELVDSFCQERGIKQQLTDDTRDKLLREFHRIYMLALA